MNYPEKTIARQFYNNLNDSFGQGGRFLPKFFRRKSADVFISIEGAGVHWSCKVERDNRKCSIACFHYDFPHKKGPEYYIEFINDKSVLATGRTSNRKFVLNAIKDWIDGKTLPELYNTYEL